MENSHFLEGKHPSASNRVLLKCSHKDTVQSKWKLYAKERRSSQNGFLLPCYRGSSCPDPWFACLCDRSRWRICCDHRASGGNAAKLEEPEQNQPVPPGAHSRGEVAWDRSREVPRFHCLPRGQTWPLCCCYLSSELHQPGLVACRCSPWWRTDGVLHPTGPSALPKWDGAQPRGWVSSVTSPPLTMGYPWCPTEYRPHTIASVKTPVLPIYSQLWKSPFLPNPWAASAQWRGR